MRDVGAIPQARLEPAQGVGLPDVRLRPRPVPRAADRPARLRITRLHIDAQITPVSVDHTGSLTVPDNPRVTGWWKGSARPGASAGSVVIDGHVDSATRGLGALFRLSEVRPGDRMIISSSTGMSTVYLAVARRSYPKTWLPAAQIFSQDVKPRLVLVTCGGTFDHSTRNYADNIVVYGVPR